MYHPIIIKLSHSKKKKNISSQGFFVAPVEKRACARLLPGSPPSASLPPDLRRSSPSAQMEKNSRPRTGGTAGVSLDREGFMGKKHGMDRCIDMYVIYKHIYIYMYIYIYLFIHLFMHLFMYISLYIYLCIHLFIHVPVIQYDFGTFIFFWA